MNKQLSEKQNVSESDKMRLDSYKKVIAMQDSIILISMKIRERTITAVRELTTFILIMKIYYRSTTPWSFKIHSPKVAFIILLHFQPSSFPLILFTTANKLNLVNQTK